MTTKEAMKIAEAKSECYICKESLSVIKEMRLSKDYKERRMVGLVIGNLKRHIKGGFHKRARQFYW